MARTLFMRIETMRTSIMHSRFRHLRPAVALAAVLLGPLAWRAPAAAQDPRPARVQETRVAVAQDLAVQTQDTGPVIRCCVQPPAGLTFWAPLDGSYATLFSGLTGSPSGTVSWVSPPPGRTGNALSLQANGRVDYLASPATSLGTGDFSIDAWIRVPFTQGETPLLDNRINNPLRGFSLFTVNGRIGFQMADGGAAPGWENYVVPQSVATNWPTTVWRFVVVTVDRNNQQGGRIYVDGVLRHTFNPTGRQGSLGTSNRLVIGHDLYSNSQGSRFEIDEVEIFSRVLTQAEITALYRYPKCRPNALP
jgi:hypothetical protein